ncbi:accessory Sec system protein Asp2, partial [Glutamicibacter arilaitensis]|uniref:accessory Sec system protein Asp2 n=1 Tax=Glutamicibacter arilaitensis TaxID=256701 RepID=UPI003FCF9BD8
MLPFYVLGHDIEITKKIIFIHINKVNPEKVVMKSVKINETEIRYDFKPAKQDRKHLVVIFSGFRKMGTFDFGGQSLSNLGAAVLWIDDNFGENYSYYIRAYGGRDISCDINTFIVEKLDELGLQLNQCTVAGFSKGASAALYYAAKFGYRNIVATVPQMRIGAYIEENWTECIKSMIGNTGVDGLRSLDRIIPDLITSCDTNKNLYLFTSPDDIQYKDEIVPFLPHFRKFVNFNLITTSSPLVTEHKLVTPYNLPLIVAIFAMLSDGISPRLGEVSNGAGYKVPLEIPTSSDACFTVGISALKIDKGRLFIDGYAVADGYSAPTWGVQSTYIHFRGPESHRVRLGQVVD